MNNICYSPEAENDLDEIWEYIPSELCNPQAAAKTVNHIFDSVERLVDFPRSGAPLSSVTDVESDYRFLVCGNYLVFYRILGKAVYIDRVLYGRGDYLRILFQGLKQEWMDD